jgi:hypothetical protein
MKDNFMPLPEYMGGSLIYYTPFEALKKLEGLETSRAVISLYMRGSCLKVVVWDAHNGEVLAEADLFNSRAHRLMNMKPQDTAIS